MNDTPRKRPPVTLLVPPLEGERPQIGRPSLVAACRGHKRIGDLLSCLVFEASCIEKDPAKDVILPLSLKKMLETFQLGIARKTLIHYIDRLNEWGLIESKPYGREYLIKIPTINATVSDPPPAEKRTVARVTADDEMAERCKDVILHLSPEDIEKGVTLHLKGVIRHEKGVIRHNNDVKLHLYTFSGDAPEAAGAGVSDPPRLLDSIDYRDSLSSAPDGAVRVSEEKENSSLLPTPADTIAAAVTSLSASSGLTPEQVAASLIQQLQHLYPAAIPLITPQPEPTPILPDFPPTSTVPAKGKPNATTTHRSNGHKPAHDTLPQLTFAGAHLLEIYTTFKKRPQVPTVSLYRAANTLGDVVTSDEVFGKVLILVRDDPFLNKKKIRRSLEWIVEHYDTYVDLVELDATNGDPPQEEPTPEEQQKRQKALDDLPAKLAALAQKQKYVQGVVNGTIIPNYAHPGDTGSGTQKTGGKP